jgi:hypothetical protein
VRAVVSALRNTNDTKPGRQIAVLAFRKAGRQNLVAPTPGDTGRTAAVTGALQQARSRLRRNEGLPVRRRQGAGDEARIRQLQYRSLLRLGKF